MRPAGREIPYDVARYLALDTLSALGGMAGFSIAGPLGMAAGYLATAVARGVVSGTIGLIRARAARRWTTRQQESRGPAPQQDRERYVAPAARTAVRPRGWAGPRTGRSGADRQVRDRRGRWADGLAHER